MCENALFPLRVAVDGAVGSCQGRVFAQVAQTTKLTKAVVQMSDIRVKSRGVHKNADGELHKRR